MKQIAVLPWRRDAHGRLQILLVTSRTSRRWMLPRGWPISGMSGAEVARTEAVEEAGVDGIVADHRPEQSVTIFFCTLAVKVTCAAAVSSPATRHVLSQ